MFLGLTFALSAVFWWLIIAAGGCGSPDSAAWTSPASRPASCRSHTSHNLYVQGFFDRVTVDTGSTRWLTTEFGAALAITIGVSAWVFWRRRDALTPLESALG
jgi:hypothetical protein